MAIGAPRRPVVWVVVRDSLVVCAAGIVVGLPLAIAGSRFLESMLFGLTPRDPISYGAALAIVVALSIVASIIPARRAVSVDPMIALRSE
jgi:ABC-type antimicrobial peptide transport system permease subunit